MLRIIQLLSITNTMNNSCFDEVDKGCEYDGKYVEMDKPRLCSSSIFFLENVPRFRFNFSSIFPALFCVQYTTFGTFLCHHSSFFSNYPDLYSAFLQAALRTSTRVMFFFSSTKFLIFCYYRMPWESIA